MDSPSLFMLSTVFHSLCSLDSKHLHAHLLILLDLEVFWGKSFINFLGFFLFLFLFLGVAHPVIAQGLFLALWGTTWDAAD